MTKLLLSSFVVYCRASQSISSANGEEALAHGLSESSSNLKDAPHSLDTDLPSNSADGEGEEGDDVVMMERIKCIHEVAYPSDWGMTLRRCLLLSRRLSLCLSL